MRKHYMVVLMFALFMATGNKGNAQRITVTIAGTGIAGYNGDGNAGNKTQISAPYDVCQDAAHNIYFTDTGNGMIRKVSAKNGLISTVAGGGTSLADGVPAITESLHPKYMCIDAAGNLYVVSSSNQIKKIDAVTNMITTVAGTGAAGYSGDKGRATSATFNGIYGICIDNAGNIYLVDQGNNCVRKIAASTGIITTIAGTSSKGYTGDGGPATAATLSSPVTICVSPVGDVFFTDQGGGAYMSRIRKITASTGIITTVAGAASGSIYDVPALSTWLGEVTGLCMNGSGDLYCNEISCSCRKMDMLTDSIYPVAGNFGIESFSDDTSSDYAYMDNPYGLCVDEANTIFVADLQNNRVRKLIQLTPTPTYAFGEGQSIVSCQGATTSLDSQLAITDLDFGQTETWTIVTAPAHGTVSGFPATALSLGTATFATPAGTSYTLSSSYTGIDSFQVLVSDGLLSDVVTIYIYSAGAGAVTGPNSVCAASTISLSADTAGGAWNSSDTTIATVSPAGVVSGVSAGSVMITYIATTMSCGLSVTEKAINIDVLPTPVEQAITGVGSVCTGSEIILADGVAGGAWSSSNANASVSAAGMVTGITPGMDTIQYAVTNTCGTATAARYVMISDCTTEGIHTVSSAPSLNIFPNPASSVLNIEWTDWTSRNTVVITDVTGREVSRTAYNNAGAGSLQADVSNLVSGVYFVKINSTEVRKFVKE